MYMYEFHHTVQLYDYTGDHLYMHVHEESVTNLDSLGVYMYMYMYVFHHTVQLHSA